MCCAAVHKLTINIAQPQIFLPPENNPLYNTNDQIAVSIKIIT